VAAVRILVTGADGFVGRRLCSWLETQGDTVVAAGGPHLSTRPGAHRLDIIDLQAVRELVEAARPEAVIHLAGISSVAQSHQNPTATFTINVLGAVNLLTAVRDLAPRARVLLVGSGEVYGPVAPGLRAFEEYPLLPTSPYAASKIGAEMAGLQFFRSYGLEVISARPFNHLGAGQDVGFVVPSFASQLQRIKRGELPPVLRVGNLEPIRDFSHVLDVVEAYRLLLERGQPGGIYNVCSGEGRTIRSLVEQLVELAGVRVEVQVDPARFRPADVPSLVGEPLRLERMGWRRSRTVGTALNEVLEEFGETKS